jgi:hypothetical protein
MAQIAIISIYMYEEDCFCLLAYLLAFLFITFWLFYARIQGSEKSKSIQDSENFVNPGTDNIKMVACFCYSVLF